jgi:hypothetical protein
MLTLVIVEIHKPCDILIPPLALSVRLFRLRVTRSQLLNAQLRQPLAHVYSRRKRLALHDTSDETTSKSITGAVCIVDLVRTNSVDGVLLDLDITSLLRYGSDSGIGALGEDNGARTLAVLLL